MKTLFFQLYRWVYSPESTTLLDAVRQAVAMSKNYKYHNAGIRVGAYMEGSDEAKLVWANDVFYQRIRG